MRERIIFKTGNDATSRLWDDHVALNSETQQRESQENEHEPEEQTKADLRFKNRVNQSPINRIDPFSISLILVST
jgi:hypothetical protein